MHQAYCEDAPNGERAVVVDGERPGSDVGNQRERDSSEQALGHGGELGGCEAGREECEGGPKSTGGHSVIVLPSFYTVCSELTPRFVISQQRVVRPAFDQGTDVQKG